MIIRIIVIILTLTIGMGYDFSARAAVIVLANRTDEEVRFTASSSAAARPYTLAKGDILTLPATRGVEVVFSVGKASHRCRLAVDEIYCFTGAEKERKLIQVGFTPVWSRLKQPVGEEIPAADPPAAKPAGVLKIPVKLLVDQAEPTVQKVWEKRLRQRVEAASDILEPCCRVRLEVVEVGTWESNEERTKLSELLEDFRGKSVPGKARLVLGFTGLRPTEQGDAALGCTPGPLHTHILIREWKPRTEPERLEVLVHELGHFLGACHSPESDSVMRPKLGDGRANLRSFRIGFDPINTLVMNLIVEEMARRPMRQLSNLSPKTRKRLLGIFATLARTSPRDPAAPHFVRLLGGSPPEPLPVRKLSPEVLNGARAVVSAIVSAAKRNQQQPDDGPRRRLTGDTLTEHYFRIAAAESRRLPAEHAVAAYLLGLGVALDRAALLHGLRLRGIDWEKIESDAEFERRLETLGEPTAHGRSALTRHFVVSAAILAVVEGQSASAGGIQEELLVLEGGDTFRFDELSANMAGITFATQLDASPGLLDELATSFRIADYLLAPRDLPDSVKRDAFRQKYGAISDERFLDEEGALLKRIQALNGYQPRPLKKEDPLSP